MKNFLIFVILWAALLVWFYDWASSGRMDRFLELHPNPQVTPVVLDALSQVYGTFQESKTASHYHRWIIAKYPDYGNVVRIRYQLAQAYEDQNERALALEQYRVLRDSFTLTTYGQLAKKKVEMSKY